MPSSSPLHGVSATIKQLSSRIKRMASKIARHGSAPTEPERTVGSEGASTSASTTAEAAGRTPDVAGVVIASESASSAPALIGASKGASSAAGVVASGTTSTAATIAPVLPNYPTVKKVQYLTTEAAVDQALAFIQSGAIGFDSEFAPRIAGDIDIFLDKLFTTVKGDKNSVLLALQALEIASGEFNIDWSTIGLCVIQIARDDRVWLLNMNVIKAFPAQLRRILVSHDIAKVGFGLVSDIPVLWYDLGTDVNNFVDVGLMTRLTFMDEKYADQTYNFLSLKTAVQDVLGLKIDKDLQKSNWRGDDNGDLSEEQRKYAAIDAQASLRCYEVIAPLLLAKSARLQTTVNGSIPASWYTFNGRLAHPVRTRPNCSGIYAPWTPVCTWFNGGKFQGYEP
ncbi:ribonuclease H-like domain-containing protein [Mycena crocata]|nr:ribonuclease H-like domain-containing protein [Mycena crocata]